MEVIKGRMYDYNNGRFLSVDPFITGTSTQSLNPYTYIFNNPLSGTDPSGYIPCKGGVKDECGSPEPKKKPKRERRKGKGLSGDWRTVYQAPTNNGNSPQFTKEEKQEISQLENNVQIASHDEQTSSFLNKWADRNGFNLGDGNLNLAEGTLAISSIGQGLSFLQYAKEPTVFIWQGKNGQWFRGGWAGNGAAGARSFAVKSGKFIDMVGQEIGNASKKIFIVGTVLSVNQGFENLRNNPNAGVVSAFAKPAVDVGFGYIGVAGGIPGAVGAGLYYTIDLTIGAERFGNGILAGAGAIGGAVKAGFDSFGRLEEERIKRGQKPIFSGPKY